MSLIEPDAADPAEAGPVRSTTDIDPLRERVRGLADGGADLATIVESLVLELPDVIDRPFNVAMALRQELGTSVSELHLVVARLVEPAEMSGPRRRGRTPSADGPVPQANRTAMPG